MLTAGRVVDKAAVLTLLRDGTKGQLGDKTRLLCLLAVMGSDTAAAKEYDAAFQAGCAAMASPPSQEAIGEYLYTDHLFLSFSLLLSVPCFVYLVILQFYY